MTDNLDDLILSKMSVRWLKVARIIAEVGEVLPHDDDKNEYDRIAAGIVALAEAGRIESQGNLKRWRYSEVRLPSTIGEKDRGPV